jgi:ATP-binding cassette subfamily G (WHITE) protein 2 (PDR)
MESLSKRDSPPLDDAEPSSSHYDPVNPSEKLELEAVETSASQYESINTGNRADLNQIVTKLSRSYTLLTSPTAGLQRRETITGLEDDDPVFDPNSTSFDLYKFVLKVVRQFQQEGITIRHSGLVFKDLNISGNGSALNLQPTLGSLLMTPFQLRDHFSSQKRPEKRILKDFNGVLKGGELLIALGRPGSGCSTLLKSMCGELHGLAIDPKSVVHYNGIPQKQIIKEFKGEAIYNQEVDKHFPHLTVGQTLEFAASVRTPEHRIKGQSRKEHVKTMTQVVMAIFNLAHTYNTKVGNDFIRGVSGGERKRKSPIHLFITLI